MTSSDDAIDLEPSGGTGGDELAVSSEGASGYTWDTIRIVVCPICGGRGTVYLYTDRPTVECGACDGRGGWVTTPD